MTNQSEQAKRLETAESIMRKYALSQQRALTMNYRADEVLEMMEEYAGVYFDQHQQSQPGIKQWVSEWIDVNDRLPEANQLVFLYSGGVFLQAYRFFPKGHVGMPEDLFYDLNNKGPLTVKEISHWMPIPLHAASTTTPKSDMVSREKVIEIIQDLHNKYKQDQTPLSERVIQECITKIKEI